MANRAAVVAGLAFLAVVAGRPTVGAQTSAAAGQSTTASAQATGSGEMSARERAITDRYLRTVRTELVSKVDTAKAKPGQEVAARVMDDADLADGTKLERGSRLLGHVVQVQPRTERQAASVVLLFDRAEVKGGQTVPVRSVIEMVAPAAGAAKMSDEPMPMGGMGGGYSQPSVGIADSSNAGVSSNGGVLGNVGRGVGGMGRGTVQPPLGTGGGMDGSVTGAAGPMGGQVGANGTGQVGGGQIGGMGTGPVGIDASTGIDAAGPIGTRPIDTVGSGPIRNVGVKPVVSAGEDVSGGARPTAMPGVVLSGASATGGSGMLVSMSRNITLDSGTRITLGVIRH